jgi:hypothetical protein
VKHEKISDATGSFFAALAAPLLRFPKTFVLLMPGLRPECVLHRPQSRDGYGHDKNIVQGSAFFQDYQLPPGRRKSLGTSSDSLPWADYTRAFIILPEAVLILVMYKSGWKRSVMLHE